MFSRKNQNRESLKSSKFFQTSPSVHRKLELIQLEQRINPATAVNDTYNAILGQTSLLNVLMNDTPNSLVQLIDNSLSNISSGLSVQQISDGTIIFQSQNVGTQSFDYSVTGKQQKLTSSLGASGDEFGHNIDIDGNFMVVGAPSDTVSGVSSQGSVTIYVRSGDLWSQQAILYAPDGALGDNFGYDVAISGNTIVVSANMDDVGSNSN